MAKQVQAVSSFHALQWLGAAYLVLVAAVFWLMAVDACADAGGVVVGLPWRCVSYRETEFTPLLARPWTFWTVVITAPVAPIALLALILRRRVRESVRMSSR
jgi:hypothetical protein